RAAYCPVSPGADSVLVNAYKTAAAKNDIVISEVGAWSNPISPDHETAKKAIQKCIDSLALADQIGASCCVNISGSRNVKHWAGPHKDNLTDATFDLIVETTRKIIDAVKPKHTYHGYQSADLLPEWRNDSRLFSQTRAANQELSCQRHYPAGR
ncbi:MAG: hypothetical protein Q8T04_06705, partial [Bacteroidota bacterium]|nr:hypothetical protein [Bacteroidota bacterium]